LTSIVPNPDTSLPPISEPPPLRHPYARDRQIAHGTDIHDPTPPPYDIVGDVHGCIDELLELLDTLGYVVEGHVIRHPQGRTLVFLGDLNDRGPSSIRVWQLAVASLEAGTARFVPGNHDSKLARYLMGRNIQLSHGLEGTVREFLALPDRQRRILGRKIGDTIADAPPYRILDDGALVVAHAGVEEWMIGRVNREVSVFARFGEPTGERSPYGFPIRRDWAATYSGRPLVVYGHTPVLEPVFRNNTINIDQGCAFGGMLTALRYPERERVSVPARAVYWEPSMAERFARAAG
jgi:protein phosphatase